MNTPMGMDVDVTIPIPGVGDATLKLFQVSTAGATYIDKLGGGFMPLPDGYGQIGGGYYDVSTTASAGGPYILCLPYSDALKDEGYARILEYDGAEWTDISLTNDPATNTVCAELGSFGILAVAAASGPDVYPLVRITSGPEFSSDSGTATFTFETDMPESMVQCSIDGASSPHSHLATAEFANCTSPITYTYLQTGSHKFRVQSLGPNGLPDETKLPIEYEWEILLPPDTNAPDTRILKGPPTLTANYAVDFEFSGVDDQTMDLDLEFECLLDGVLLGSCDSIPTTETVLGIPYTVEVEENAYGRHTLDIRAIDEFGNVDPTPAKRIWTYIDVTAPETSIELGPESETEGTIAIFEFIGETIEGMPVFDFECSLDGAQFEYCTSPHTIENLSVGPHYFEVRALGANGSRDSTPELEEWLIIPPLDTTGPDHDDRDRPRSALRPGRDLRLPGERAGRGVRVHARRRGVGRLRRHPRDDRPPAGPARARGPRVRHLGERRPVRPAHVDVRRRARHLHHAAAPA